MTIEHAPFVPETRPYDGLSRLNLTYFTNKYWGKSNRSCQPAAREVEPQSQSFGQYMCLLGHDHESKKKFFW